jgi:ubiquinone/menaquinone biosynthesis C-methylase UbiE
MAKPTERFTHAVQNYVKYRPSYTQDILQVLIKDCHLTKDSIVADVGSGTGFLSKLFLDFGNTVYGVEPNQEMRKAAETYLKSYTNFHSIAASAEMTTLNEHSIDIVTAGTAFHWFQPEAAKFEFKRILKSPGWVLLVWNVRNMEESALIREYEKLSIHYCKDYCESNAHLLDKSVASSFFSPFEMTVKSFRNTQQFDWEGLQGRLLSTSYSLRPGDIHYEEMMQELKNIFDRYQKNGMIEFLYNTKLYYGHLHPC